MCGIAGIISWAPDRSIVDVERRTGAMVDQLRHRGPDGHAQTTVWRTGTDGGPAVVFGHTRLAIIDLSEGGRQPKTSAGGALAITFNGEIYNYRALRAELTALGRRFETESDTEVILQGYDVWGTAIVSRLRGMFAFALWDARRRVTLLARDRVGIKPLYVHRGPHHVVFGSEIRALLASGLVPRRLDPIALDQFLTYQTVPTPRTLVEGVEWLAPGSILTVALDGVVEQHSYWSMLDAASSATRITLPGEARERVHAGLLDATRAHLVSDVPVAVFLSGGIDSTALVSLVRQTGAVPRTFGVAFPGTAYDESPYARAAAAAYGADHTEVVLTENDLRAQVPDALESFDHPSGDGINTYLVSRAVHDAGVKVAMSGLGGDEMFGGYPSFERLRRTRGWGRAWRHSPAVMRSAAGAAVRRLGRGSVGAEKTASLLETDGGVPQMFPVLRRMFAAGDRRRLIGDGPLRAASIAGDPYVALLEHAASRAGVEPMSLISFAEARTYMHDVLLRDTDQMSMRHALEARVPLLDHELIETVMALDDDVKRPAGRPKSLLLESVGDPLPPVCVDRPKRGFVLPLDVWMRHELRPLCEHYLGADGLGGRREFRAAGVAEQWRAFLAGEARTSWSRVWTLVTLASWLERTGVTGEWDAA